MRWLKIIGGILAVLVLLMVGALVYVSTLDPEQFRGPVSRAVTDATGRKFEIKGPMDLKVSLTPSVVANDIRLANADWGSRPEMVKVKRFELALQLIPLVFGNVHISHVALIEPDILLETDKQGRGNWQFKPAGAAGGGKGAGEAGGGGGGGGGGTNLPSINEVRIDHGRLTWKDGQTGKTTTVALEQFTGSADGADAPLAFQLKAMVNDLPVGAEGKVGPLASAMQPGAPLNLDVTANVLGIDLIAKGQRRGEALDLAVKADADDLSGLQKVGVSGLPAHQPLHLSANLKGRGQQYTLQDLALKLGDSDIGGQASVDLGGKRPQFDADLKGQRVDLTALLPKSEGGGAGKGGSGPAKSGGRSDKLFPDTPLPLDGLKAADGKASLQIAELVAPAMALHDVEVKAALKNGRLSLDPLKATAAGSPVSGKAVLDGSSGKTASLDFALKAPKVDVGRLMAETKTTDLVEGNASLGIDLKGSGASVAGIMGSLDGSTDLLMQKGRIRTAALDLAVGGLSKVVGTLTSSKSDWTVLNCAASRFAVKDGIADSQVMLVDSQYSTVVGDGTIDLKNERFDLTINPKAKSPTLNVAVPLHVTGPLAHPSVQPDKLAAAKKLGGLLGGTMFPPAALLALGDLGNGGGNACLDLAKGKGAAAQPSQQQEDSGPVEGAKKTLENLGNGLKDLLGGDKK